SFLRFFTRHGSKSQRPSRKAARRERSSRLWVEPLESRELLATAPTIIASGVLPVDGSASASAQPVIQVQYSETLTNTATHPTNYVLLGSSGNPVAINGASFVDTPTNTTVQLTYNSGQPLVVDTYTLYVRGDKVTDVNDGLALAQPGQLLVANAGRNNLAVV